VQIAERNSLRMMHLIAKEMTAMEAHAQSSLPKMIPYL
jgi:hypothetical protein